MVAPPGEIGSPISQGEIKDADEQVCARSMADLLITANKQATAARAAGQAGLSDEQLAQIRSWYRGAVAKGLADNQNKHSKIGRDGPRQPNGASMPSTPSSSCSPTVHGYQKPSAPAE